MEADVLWASQSEFSAAFPDESFNASGAKAFIHF